MPDYNMVKRCRACRKRFVQSKAYAKNYYCSNCEGKYASKNVINANS